MGKGEGASGIFYRVISRDFVKRAAFARNQTNNSGLLRRSAGGDGGESGGSLLRGGGIGVK